jgi:hypothetical protein
LALTVAFQKRDCFKPTTSNHIQPHPTLQFWDQFRLWVPYDGPLVVTDSDRPQKWAKKGTLEQKISDSGAEMRSCQLERAEALMQHIQQLGEIQVSWVTKGTQPGYD